MQQGSIKVHYPCRKQVWKVSYLQNPDKGHFPKTNQSSYLVFLLQTSFNAHDALEDVVALRKYILSYGLTFDKNNTVKNYCLVHAAEDLVYNIQITAIFQKLKNIDINFTICINKKPKNHLFADISPDFRLNGQIWLVYAEKVDFVRKPW